MSDVASQRDFSWPGGARCAFSISWDVDVDSMLHLQTATVPSSSTPRYLTGGALLESGGFLTRSGTRTSLAVHHGWGHESSGCRN